LAAGGQSSSHQRPTAYIWDLQQPMAAPVALPVYSMTFAVAFASVSSTLALGGESGAVQLWDVRQPSQPPRVLSVYPMWIRALAFSPDGSHLAAGFERNYRVVSSGGGTVSNLDGDNTLRLWDLNALQTPPREMTGTIETAYSVAFNPDGMFLTSGGTEEAVHLWDIRQPQPTLAVSVDHYETVVGLAFSPDRQWLAAGVIDVRPIDHNDDHKVRIWDMRHLDAAPLVIHPPDCLVHDVAFSQDSQLLAVGCIEDKVLLWNVPQLNAAPKTLKTSGSVESLAFPRAGKTLAAGNLDGSVYLWHLDRLNDQPVILTAP
jgi:WD40 repeat protein